MKKKEVPLASISMNHFKTSLNEASIETAMKEIVNYKDPEFKIFFQESNENWKSQYFPF